MKSQNTKTVFLKGMRTGIPIALGYFAVAFALGITARNAGISAPWSGVMSLGMLASAGDYSAIELIGAGAGRLEMISTTIIVNLRYFLMGCALSQKLDEHLPLLHRFLLSYCITDEIFAVSVSVNGFLNPFYTYGVTVISAFGWTFGTVMGVLMGQILPVRLVSALSVALYGMFLAVIIPAARSDAFVAVVIFISMLASYLFTALPLLRNISFGFRVILLTVCIAAVAAWLHPVEEM